MVSYIRGFVQMAGEIYEDDDTKKIPKEQFMCNRPWYQRLIILVAGVFNNFLLAIILLFAMALIWGAPSLKPVVYDVTDGYPAKEAGIKAGDVIKSINGSKVKTLDKTQLLLLLKTKDDKYQITVEHKNGQTATYEVVPKKEKNDDGDEVKVFGIQTKTNITKGFGSSVKYAFTKFGSVVEQMWLTIVNLFTGKISISAMSGPVGIYSVVGETRSAGVESVIYLIAYLSINLGIMNILPIPALDGGHLLFLIIEKIRGKKIDEKIEGITTTIFFALLLLLMLYITIHDVIRLIF